jgi:hypothetical protein
VSPNEVDVSEVAFEVQCVSEVASEVQCAEY